MGGAVNTTGSSHGTELLAHRGGRSPVGPRPKSPRRPGGGDKGKRIWAGASKNHGDENQWPLDESVRSGLRGCRVAGKGSHFYRDRSCPRVLTFGCSPWHLRRREQDGRGPRLVWRRKGAGEPLLACPAGAWRSIPKAPSPHLALVFQLSAPEEDDGKRQNQEELRVKCQVTMARSFSVLLLNPNYLVCPSKTSGGKADWAWTSHRP